MLSSVVAAAALMGSVVQTGAAVMANSGFEVLQGKRVGLVTNHTAMVGDKHLIDLLHEDKGVTIAALFGPEHGLRGLADAGEKVSDGKDAATGAPIFSLYGETRRPSSEMLEGVNVLVFDIQDVGARFYTYISTLGLCMQSAAEAGIPFVVLDRPNPLGGANVAGWIREPDLESFVGQYPIPIQHGLTVGELAKMVKGEGWLPGLDKLELTVVPCQGWSRSQLWPETGLPWIKTSPNIPDFETALLYAGTCLFEGLTASEGRGTQAPFLTLGAEKIDSSLLVQKLNAKKLPGVRFAVNDFTPRGIEGMSSNPKFKDVALNGLKIQVTDANAVKPVEVGLQLVDAFYHAVPESARAEFFNERWFAMLSGTPKCAEMIRAGQTPAQVIESYQAEVAGFEALRKKYLLYK